MQRSLLSAFAGALLIAAAACSSSTSKPADNPDGESSNTDTSGGESGDSESGAGKSGESDTTALPMGTVKNTQDDTIPDDYTMLSGDCVALREKLRSLIRGENMAKIDPKISDEKREKAEVNINAVADKLSKQLFDMCDSSLVGKVFERERLKCAMEARSHEAFNKCLGVTVEQK